jgi:hypothetical protein
LATNSKPYSTSRRKKGTEIDAKLKIREPKLRGELEDLLSVGAPRSCVAQLPFFEVAALRRISNEWKSRKI